VIVISYIVLHIGFNCEATVETIFTSFGWRPCAFTANVNWCAFTSLKVVGNVLLARGVNEAIVMGPLVNGTGVSTVASSTGLTVNNNLGV
jgi:hypothetical protein